MGEGLNKVLVLGNIGKEPELRTGSTAVLKFSLACNERRKDKEGNWVDHCEWVPIVIFGKRAEALAKFLGKGSSICVEGKLRTSSYEARDGGGKRYKTEVVADNVILCGGRGERTERRESSGGGAGTHTTQTEDEFANDEAIPF